MPWVDALVWLAGLCTANPAVIHERRDVPIEGAIRRQRIDSGATIPIRIGLVQNEHATRNAKEWLMAVSDPDSPRYGKFWSQQEVIDAFQPTQKSVQAVTQWLAEHNITEVTHSDNKMWIAFDATVDKAEHLLQTEYFEHQRSSDGRFEVTCDQYYLPQYLQPHIHYIKPGVTGIEVTGLTRRYVRQGKPKRKTRLRPGDHSGILEKSDGSERALKNSVKYCDRHVTPACIRALYNFSSADPSLPVNSSNDLGIFELGNWYFQPDLDRFYAKYTDIPVGTTPIFKSIDGAHRPPKKSHWPYVFWEARITEADLDFQVALPIVYPQNVTLLESTFAYDGFGRFLDAIDGSYCQKTNYPGKVQCGVYKPPYVVSFSYSNENENQLRVSDQIKLCNEFLKLGLQGTSLFFASGDSGVGPCTKHGRLFALYGPDGCPWITDVGGTQLQPGKTVFDPEEAWHGRYSASGGGFSVVFDTPDYQKDAIAKYFNTSDPPYPYFTNGQFKNSTGRYNRNGRGYPDISAVSNHVEIFRADNLIREAGTSAAAPLVAALFNRIVEERLRAGKGPLGFVNPALYKHPEVLNDIVIGNNPGYNCDSKGFECAVGWDPVTGLGTPNYASSKYMRRAMIDDCETLKGNDSNGTYVKFSKDAKKLECMEEVLEDECSWH